MDMESMRQSGAVASRSSHSRVSTGSEGWLLAERPLPGHDGDVEWYHSNLPPHTALERLVGLEHMAERHRRQVHSPVHQGDHVLDVREAIPGRWVKVPRHVVAEIRILDIWP